MRSPAIVSLALCTFGLGGLAGALALAHGGSGPAVPAGDGATKLARALEALAADVDTVKQRIEQLERLPQSAATARLEPKFEALLRAGLPPKELAQLLKEAAAAGEDDASIAALLAIIDKNPNDPHARYALAKAYCERVMREANPAGYEHWGGLALDAWQKAADLDANYWEPRYERAEYLTYWPESEGKTPEVITSLEDLIKLQGGSNSNPRYARTYAHLSRMYLRVGNRDKALQTLRDGLALFPDNQELSGQLKVLKGD